MKTIRTSSRPIWPRTQFSMFLKNTLASGSDLDINQVLIVGLFFFVLIRRGRRRRPWPTQILGAIAVPLFVLYFSGDHGLVLGHQGHDLSLRIDGIHA